MEHIETGPGPVNQNQVTPAPKPEVKKGSFRRSEKGKIVYGTLARWIAAKLRSSGLTFEEWLAKGWQLSDINVSRSSAVTELKQQIPDAHIWFNESGDSRKFFPTWESYWNVSLVNRAIYFFRKHKPGGGIVACLGEWPGTLENGQLIPPQVSPEEVTA